MCHGGCLSCFPPGRTLPRNQHFHSFVLVFCSEGTSTVTRDTTQGHTDFGGPLVVHSLSFTAKQARTSRRLPPGVQVRWKRPDGAGLQPGLLSTCQLTAPASTAGSRPSNRVLLATQWKAESQQAADLRRRSRNPAGVFRRPEGRPAGRGGPREQARCREDGLSEGAFSLRPCYPTGR